MGCPLPTDGKTLKKLVITANFTVVRRGDSGFRKKGGKIRSEKASTSKEEKRRGKFYTCDDQRPVQG